MPTYRFDIEDAKRKWRWTISSTTKGWRLSPCIDPQREYYATREAAAEAVCAGTTGHDAWLNSPVREEACGPFDTVWTEVKR